jgi:antitoxin component YwqK of YwqJK toxin-antitoxin module
MKKIPIITLIITILITAGLSAQDINKFDENGKHHGTWIKYYAGKPVVRYEGQFEHGVPVGEFRYYYETAKLQTIATYSDNGTLCKTVSYFGNGTKLAEGDYLNRKKDGKWIFYDGYSNVIAVDYYKNDKRHGQCMTYLPTGELIEEINYDNGVQHGMWKRYFSNGNLHFQGNVVKGKWQGPYVFNYPDGKKQVAGVYEQSLKQGDWLYYDDKGQLIKVETFVEGKIATKKVFQKEKDSEYLELKEAETILEKMKSGVHDDGPIKTPFD